MVAIFYLASWQLGAVEAISLSILVGTSVDYCVHLVEGYIMAGNFIPNLHENSNKVCLNLFFKLFVCVFALPSVGLANGLSKIWLLQNLTDN